MENKVQHDFIDSYCSRKNEIPYGASWTDAYNHLIDEGIVGPSEKELNRIKKKITNKGIKENDPDMERQVKREFTIQYFEMKYGITRSTIML